MSELEEEREVLADDEADDDNGLDFGTEIDDGGIDDEGDDDESEDDKPGGYGNAGDELEADED